MIFTTYWFFLFIAIFTPLYWLARPAWVRLALLIVGCSVFHAQFAGAAGMLPIIALCVTTYLAGLSRRRWALHVGILLPVLALVFYKYTHFFSTKILVHLSASAGLQFDQYLQAYMPLTPPLGVSFFAFEFVHYLYDVSKGKPSIRNPAHFWAFTFYFPSLVAGPIKRYQPFLKSLSSGLREVTLEDVKIGFWRITEGFVKKVILADNLTSAIQYWHPHYEEFSIGGRWLFVAAVALRILFDFSGYSDLAIGFSRLLGIRLDENFNWPYLSKNLQDFWQRWHISLSSWIRDYVYIPLGGSRHGPFRKVFNGLFAFSLCGLWHGPDWSFVLWGVWHGVGLVISTQYALWLGAPGRLLARFFARVPVFAWLLTMVYVAVGLLCFFYPVAEFYRMTCLLFVSKL